MPKNAAQRRAPHEAVIPDKLYFRIGEVAKLCGVETYVLRFWETEFPQLRPNKSGTGQRLYRKRDVELALRVRRLLHDEGYTIAGARQVLAQESAKPKSPELPVIEDASAGHAADPPEGNPRGTAGVDRSPAVEAKLQRLRVELKELLGILSARPVHVHTLASEPKSKPRIVSRSAGPSLFD